MYGSMNSYKPRFPNNTHRDQVGNTTEGDGPGGGDQAGGWWMTSVLSEEGWPGPVAVQEPQRHIFMLREARNPDSSEKCPHF